MWLRPVADLLLTSKSNHQVSFEFQSNYYFTSKSSIDDSYFYLLALFGHRKKISQQLRFHFLNWRQRIITRRKHICADMSFVAERALCLLDWRGFATFGVRIYLSREACDFSKKSCREALDDGDCLDEDVARRISGACLPLPICKEEDISE